MLYAARTFLGARFGEETRPATERPTNPSDRQNYGIWKFDNPLALKIVYLRSDLKGFRGSALGT